MSVFDDVLDYNKPEGWSTRVKECPQCEGSGNSPAVQLTRREDGFVWTCFRCRNAGQKKFSGFISDKLASPDQVKQLIRAQVERKTNNTRPEVVTLPADYTTDIPAKALVQLFDMEIMHDAIREHDIGWSPGRARIIIPVYKWAVGSDGTKGKRLVGVMGRKLTDQPDDKPKWWSIRQRDIKHPRFIAIPSNPAEVLQKTVCIVEDIFSAIKIAQAGYLSTALMTTYLPYELYHVLAGWHVLLWLDADAHGKAVKYQTTLGQNAVRADVINTPEDPKFYSLDLITKYIKDKL